MMKLREELKETIVPAVLNSYSVVFFFNNSVLALVLLVVTLFNLVAGISGLVSVICAVLVAYNLGFDRNLLKQGIYSFNALLAGISLGTFYEPGLVFFVILLLGSLLSLILSITMGGWFGKHSLPFLSLPFILTFWIIVIPADHFVNLGLTQRNVFWINEMYSIGGKHLLDLFQTVENLPLSRMVVYYLKSLSSIFFQENLFAGIIISLVLLTGSRITFLLSLAGFFTAYLFATFAGTDMVSFSYYNVGANYILVAIAAGGFFTIPSVWSFLWTIILIPLTSLLILSLTRLLTIAGLPVFSLPFSLITILYIFFLLLRVKPGKLVLTWFQSFSPEVNLYSYRTNVHRHPVGSYVTLHLPFWGEWIVSQGHDGPHTHKGEWSSALDFMLVDETGKSWERSPAECNNYFCYDKPVVSPGDGEIADIIDSVPDNEPGKVNTSQNWGNTVVIRHTTGLYSQLSHLRPGSIKVRKGMFVRQGDIIGHCGNSGRSPEPHIHFQVQSNPVAGAKTLYYPVAYYILKDRGEKILKSFSVPREGDIVSNVASCNLLKSAFDFQPGMILSYSYTTDLGAEKTERWEVFTDAYNYRYLYCAETKSYAYFTNDGTMFSFTSFSGDRSSLLYAFYIQCYKVLLAYYPSMETTDLLPLHLVRRYRLILWLHDFIAPFCDCIRVIYRSRATWADTGIDPTTLTIDTSVDINTPAGTRKEAPGRIIIEKNRIKEFTIKTGNKVIWAKNSDI
ncbi:MAG: urea transporter [Bacteroidales bacterium]